MRTHRIAIGLAAFGLALAGCSTSGTPQPSPSAVGASQSPSAAESTALAQLNPCTLITAQEAATVRLTPLGAKPVAYGTGRGCQWEADANVVGASNNYILGIDIQPHKGLQDYNTSGEQITPLSFGKHSGQQAFDGAEGCFVTFTITRSSTVNVQVSADPPKSCQLASQYAQLIEPKLPAG